MHKFIKKGSRGVFVTAAKVTEEEVEEIAAWADAQIVEEKDPISGDIFRGLNVKTVGGNTRASNGTYVGQNENGGFFVIPGGKFETLFEPVKVIEDVELHSVSIDDQPNAFGETITPVFLPKTERLIGFEEGPKE